ncbi:MAG: hypothetical protein RL419_2003 [Actinomycetota bacterium]|jgi:hypothetical protein
MGLRRNLIAVATVVAAGVSVFGAPIDAAGGVTVSGKFADAAVSKVLLVASTGRTFAARASRGSFSIAGVPASGVKNASVHAVDSSGKYLGPVVLSVAKEVSKKKATGKYKSIIGLKGVSKGKLTLGSIRGASTGWYRAGSSSAAGTAGSRAADKTGKPRGAGTAGRKVIVKGASVHKNGASWGVVHAMAGTTCPDGGPLDPLFNGTKAGQDLDCDGVMNAIDVDDNGDGSLDMTDQKSTESGGKQNTVNLMTYADFRLQQAAGVNARATTDTAELISRIKSVLSGTSSSGSFGISIFLQERMLTNSMEENPALSPDGVWVECAGIKWCDTSGQFTPTAKISGFSEGGPSNQTGLSWSTFPSSDYSSGTGVATTVEAAKKNGLFRFKRSTGGGRTDHIWGANLTPAWSGDDVLTAIRANDVLQLHVVKGGVDTVYTMTVSPFLMTVPYVKSAGTNSTARVSAGTLQLDSSGKLPLTFYRPQRLVLEGESSSTGSLVPQHNLNYGVTFEQLYLGNQMYRPQGSEIGCGAEDYATNYTGLSSTLKGSASQYGEMDGLANQFWPIKDDSADSAADDDLSFTLDVKNCLQTALQRTENGGKGTTPIWKSFGTSHATFDAFWSAFNADQFAKLEVVLAGVGAPMTSGYNRAGVQLQLFSSAWTGSSSSGNSGSSGSGSSGSGSSGSGSSGSTSTTTTTTIATYSVVAQSSGGTNGYRIANSNNCNGNWGPGTNCTTSINPGSSFTIASQGATISLNSGATSAAAGCVATSFNLITCTPTGNGTVTFTAN